MLEYQNADQNTSMTGTGQNTISTLRKILKIHFHYYGKLKETTRKNERNFVENFGSHRITSPEKTFTWSSMAEAGKVQ